MNATNELSVAGKGYHQRSRQVSRDGGQLRLGARSENEWKVVDKNRLINIVDLGSFKRAILLTVNGSTCSAEVDFELKPGFSDYEFKRNNGKNGYRFDPSRQGGSTIRSGHPERLRSCRGRGCSLRNCCQ